MKNYEVVINGQALTVQMTEETAKKMKLKEAKTAEVKTKQTKPANKARKVADK